MATSTTQAVYEQLRAQLLTGWRPGERLKINELGERFSVSIGAVREALSRLTSDGLVVAEPQRGFRVAPMSIDDMRELTAARIEIEQACLRRALACGDVAWESELIAVHHRLARTPTHPAGASDSFNPLWIAAHADFHSALTSACDNRWLLRMREMLSVQHARYLDFAVAIDRGTRDAAREHRELMEMALARDADRISALIAAHLDRTRVTVETAMTASVA